MGKTAEVLAERQQARGEGVAVRGARGALLRYSGIHQQRQDEKVQAHPPSSCATTARRPVAFRISSCLLCSGVPTALIAITIKKHGRRTVIMYDTTRGNCATGRPPLSQGPALLTIRVSSRTRVRGEVRSWNTVSYGREITNDVPTQSS